MRIRALVAVLLLVPAGVVGAGASSAQASSWHACSESKPRISKLKVWQETCATARVVMRAWLRKDICDEVKGIGASCFVDPRGRQWECKIDDQSARSLNIDCASYRPMRGAKKKPATVLFKAKKT